MAVLQPVIRRVVSPIIIGIGGRRGSAGKVLPQQLIVTPDTIIEEMDATTGWTSNAAVFELNTSEFKHGNASLKCTSASGATARLEKNVSWNFSSDNGTTFKVWIYPHTDPLTTLSGLSIYFAKESAFTNYFKLYVNPTKLKQNVWNLISVNTLTQPGGVLEVTGSPTWDNITRFRVSATPVAGQVFTFSCDLIENNALNKHAAVIMFDDNYSAIYTKAYPYLKAKKMVGTCYIYSTAINDNGLLTSAQLVALNGEGWDIANHTKTHPDLTLLSQAEVESELSDCKIALDNLGLTRSSSHVAYPFGRANATTDLALAAFGALTGRGGGVTTPHGDYNIGWPYRLAWSGPITVAGTKTWIDNAITQNACLFLTFHDIVDANPSETVTLYSDFTQIIDYIESLGLQTLTIDEYYRLNSGAITVNHK